MVRRRPAQEPERGGTQDECSNGNRQIDLKIGAAVHVKVQRKASLTVCLATYNGAAYLAEQIDSILEQLDEGDELLVADDGSSDDTPAILHSYGTRLTVHSLERVGGVVANFGRLLAAAEGDLIALADQDDVWLAGRVATIRRSLQQAHLVIMNGQVVDADLNLRGLTVFNSVRMKPGFMSNFVRNSYIGCCMAFRRELCDLVTPLPAAVPWHDWYIGLVAELHFTVLRVDEVSMLYRRHGANFSPTGEKSTYSLKKKILMRFNILRAVLISGLRKLASPKPS